MGNIEESIDYTPHMLDVLLELRKDLFYNSMKSDDMFGPLNIKSAVIAFAVAMKLMETTGSSMMFRFTEKGNEVLDEWMKLKIL
jgi:hypothetical protein